MAQWVLENVLMFPTPSYNHFVILALKVPRLIQFKEWFQDYPRCSSCQTNIRGVALKFRFRPPHLQTIFHYFSCRFVSAVLGFCVGFDLSKYLFAWEAFTTLGTVQNLVIRFCKNKRIVFSLDVFSLVD